MKKGEVTIHSQEPINFLLCGSLPVVTSRKPVSKNKNLNSQEPQFDMTGFPEPITNYKKRRPKTSIDTIRHRNKSETLTTPKYNQLRTDTPFLQTMEQNLNTYRDNHKRKVAQIHQDYEERYAQPYLERMRNRLNGENYREYRRTKSRAITALGPRPIYNTLSLDTPYEMPSVRINTAGLVDKVHNSTRYLNKEKVLRKEILGSTGEKPMPKPLRPAQEVLNQLKETRFYDGDSSLPAPIGRRAYPEILSSTVYQQIHTLD